MEAIERFRALLDVAPDAMLVADRSGRIRLANGQAVALFGYTEAELIDQPIEILLPERYRARHAGHRSGYHADPRPRPMGASLALFGLKKDGTEFPTEISLSPIEEAGETVVIAAIRDISERRRIELERERAVQARDELLAMVSHDLQNAVNALVLNLQVLLRLKPESEREKRMHDYGLIMGHSADAMTRLIQDLLDARQIEMGRFIVDIHPEDAAALVREALTPLQAVADEKRIALEARVDGSPQVLCDRERIVQVLHNLVGNALKFVPAGGHVRVEIRAEASDVRFSVVDDGPGVHPEDLPHVFDRHWRAASHALRRGSGLGLFIVKSIVEAHAGRVWVDSNHGAGAVFCFSLPGA